MYSREQYAEMAEKANEENKVLYIIGTGLPDAEGLYDGELVLADNGYYVCLDGTTITDGTLNPEYGENKKRERYEYLRKKREEICFPVVNRGKVWYDKLSIVQYEELKAWYQAWLCVTDTLVEPVTPEWIS